ncbi:MAG: hypothetical protein ACRCW7_09255 [Cetobacterium sp.]
MSFFVAFIALFLVIYNPKVAFIAFATLFVWWLMFSNPMIGFSIAIILIILAFK